jgi:hypothetical protein
VLFPLKYVQYLAEHAIDADEWEPVGYLSSDDAIRVNSTEEQAEPSSGAVQGEQAKVLITRNSQRRHANVASATLDSSEKCPQCRRSRCSCTRVVARLAKETEAERHAREDLLRNCWYEGYTLQNFLRSLMPVEGENTPLVY